MTAKYSAAKNLAVNGGQVTIKGNSALGIPVQNVSGSTIVGRMETMQTIATAQSAGNRVASVTANPSQCAVSTGKRSGGPADGPITFWRDGASAPKSVAQTFGHEILHTIYSGVGLQNRGWANPDSNLLHQAPFDEASDEIQ